MVTKHGDEHARPRIIIDRPLTENDNCTSTQSHQERYLTELHCRLTSARSMARNIEIVRHVVSQYLHWAAESHECFADYHQLD